MHQDCSGQTVELTFEPEYQEQLEDATRMVFLVAAPFTGFQSEHSRPVRIGIIFAALAGDESFPPRSTARW